MRYFHHEPAEYCCPFCLLLQGSSDALLTRQDIVYQDKLVSAFISPRWWPNNCGHVIIIPNLHVENIYELRSQEAYALADATKRVALALRHTYQCEGVSTRQHNEPAGNQDVWHYHLHVFPRYEGDRLYESQPLPEFASAEQRLPYADKLRKYLSTL